LLLVCWNVLNHARVLYFQNVLGTVPFELGNFLTPTFIRSANVVVNTSFGVNVYLGIFTAQLITIRSNHFTIRLNYNTTELQCILRRTRKSVSFVLRPKEDASQWRWHRIPQLERATNAHSQVYCEWLLIRIIRDPHGMKYTYDTEKHPMAVRDTTGQYNLSAKYSVSFTC